MKSDKDEAHLMRLQSTGKNKKPSRLELFIPEALQFLVWVPAQVLLKFFVSFRVSGRENLREVEKRKRKGEIHGVIFAANHASELDPIVVRAAMKPVSKVTPLHYVARARGYYKDKQFLAKFMYGGSFFRWWGAYPAYSGMKDYRESLCHHIELLKQGRSLLIFPEGRRTPDGELGEARGGVAFLSHELCLLVVPVSIEGTYGLGWKNFLLRRNCVRVSFGGVLYPKGLFTEKQLATEALTREEYRETAWFILSQTRAILDDHGIY